MNPRRPIVLATSSPLVPEVVSAAALLRDRQVLVIEHGGARYQLRITKSGKLILTK